MKITIWSILIVIIVGIRDFYLAYQRWPKANSNSKPRAKNAPKTDKTTAKMFLTLGIIFTIGGIILLFWH